MQRGPGAFRARWMRWHKAWKAADGLFIEEIGSDALKERGLPRLCSGEALGAFGLTEPGGGADAGVFSRLSESTRKVAATTIRSPG